LSFKSFISHALCFACYGSNHTSRRRNFYVAVSLSPPCFGGVLAIGFVEVLAVLPWHQSWGGWSPGLLAKVSFHFGVG